MMKALNIARIGPLVLAMFIVLSGCSRGISLLAPEKEVEKQNMISGLLSELEHNHDETARIQIAQRLAEVISNDSATSFRERDIAEHLRIFLQDKNDAVRYWIATALGELGSPAIEVVPALLVALADRVNDYSSKSSSSAIRVALDRIDPDWRKRSDVPGKVLMRWP